MALFFRNNFLVIFDPIKVHSFSPTAFAEINSLDLIYYSSYDFIKEEGNVALLFVVTFPIPSNINYNIKVLSIDPATGMMSLLSTYTGHTAPVTDLKINYKDTQAISIDTYGFIKVWNYNTGAQLDSEQPNATPYLYKALRRLEVDVLNS